MTTPKVGNKAPVFKGICTGKGSVDLSKLKGKKVILWCKYCKIPNKIQHIWECITMDSNVFAYVISFHFVVFTRSTFPFQEWTLNSLWYCFKYLGILSVIITFLIWFTITADGLALVRKFIFPSPRQVLIAVIRISDIIPLDIVYTLTRLIIGFSLGAILGVITGLLMSYNKIIDAILDPIVESIRPVPVIAMIPFLIMWFGIGEAGKIFLITLGVFAIIVVSTLEAVKNVPKIYIRAAKTLGASNNQIFRTIIIPGMLPGLIGPLRVATALSFTLVVAAEFMGAQNGIGYRIMEARRLFYTDVILLNVVLITILAAVADRLVRAITNYLTRWSERN